MIKVSFDTTFNNFKKNSEDQYIIEYNEPHYEALDLYDKRHSLKKTNFAIRRLMKESENKEPVKTILEYQMLYLMIKNNNQVELIKFTQSTDGTSDEKESIFTGVKAVWYDRPFRELIDKFYNDDINDFYVTVENMEGDEISTSWGRIPKNLALQFIQNLRLIVSGGSVERANRGIFKIHHDLQIAPTHVVKILEELNISCRPQCVMKKSEAEYERGLAPKWLTNLADKPHKLNSWGDELTEEEKRVFAKAKGGKVIVMRGGCKCGHNKSDHGLIGEMCIYHKTCDCNTFKLRTDTKETIEIK